MSSGADGFRLAEAWAPWDGSAANRAKPAEAANPAEAGSGAAVRNAESAASG